MAEELKGWRWGLKMTHAGSDILPLGKDVSVTIEKVEARAGELVGGNKMDTYVAIFRPNPYTDLPMALRSTNLKQLRKLTGLEDPVFIKDFNVILTREWVNDPQGGGKCWGLRVSKIKAEQNGIVQFKPNESTTTPTERVKLSLTSPNYQQLATWLSEDKHTLAGLLGKYDADEECLVELRKIKSE